MTRVSKIKNFISYTPPYLARKLESRQNSNSTIKDPCEDRGPTTLYTHFTPPTQVKGEKSRTEVTFEFHVNRQRCRSLKGRDGFNHGRSTLESRQWLDGSAQREDGLMGSRDSLKGEGNTVKTLLVREGPYGGRRTVQGGKGRLGTWCKKRNFGRSWRCLVLEVTRKRSEGHKKRTGVVNNLGDRLSKT